MYKYGMLLRPCGIGCQPKGFIKFKDVNKNNDGYWSYVWYNSKLTPEELFNYDMHYIGEDPDEHSN